MKRLEILLWIGMAGACLLMPLPLTAQENKQEDVPTLSADSLITGDARMDSLYRHLPEVMVVGERPVVRASAGKLEYDLPRMIQDRPVDNIYEALKELPGVVEQDGALKLGMQGVTVVLDGKVTNMSTDQLYALLKSMPADRIERVEVMYNAPARYQVRGAMINVRLRRRIGDPGVVQGELYGKYNQEHEASFEERQLQHHRQGSSPLAAGRWLDASHRQLRGDARPLPHPQFQGRNGLCAGREPFAELCL